MSQVKPYHQLVVWKEAHGFVLAVYAATESFPKHEQFGITSQLRRAAVSVPTNIVEGYGKHSAKELARYCDIATGSLMECEYLLELSRDLTYLTPDQYATLEDHRSRTSFLLNRFLQSKK